MDRKGTANTPDTLRPAAKRQRHAVLVDRSITARCKHRRCRRHRDRPGVYTSDRVGGQIISGDRLVAGRSHARHLRHTGEIDRPCVGIAGRSPQPPTPSGRPPSLQPSASTRDAVIGVTPLNSPAGRIALAAVLSSKLESSSATRSCRRTVGHHHLDARRRVHQQFFAENREQANLRGARLTVVNGMVVTGLAELSPTQPPISACGLRKRRDRDHTDAGRHRDVHCLVGQRCKGGCALRPG